MSERIVKTRSVKPTRKFKEFYPEHAMFLASIDVVKDLITTIESTFEPERIEEHRFDPIGNMRNGASTRTVTACLWARKIIEDVEDDLKSEHNYDIASQKVGYYPYQKKAGRLTLSDASDLEKEPELIGIRDLFNTIIHSEFIRFSYGADPNMPSFLVSANYEPKGNQNQKHRKIQITIDELIKALRVVCLSENLIIHILLDRGMRYIRNYPLKWEEATNNLKQQGPLLIFWDLMYNNINSNEEVQEFLQQHYEKHTGKRIKIENIEVSYEELEFAFLTTKLFMKPGGTGKKIQVPIRQVVEIIKKQHPVDLT